MERCKICDGALYFNEEIWDYACPRCEPEKVKPKCPKCRGEMVSVIQSYSSATGSSAEWYGCKECGYLEVV